MFSRPWNCYRQYQYRQTTKMVQNLILKRKLDKIHCKIDVKTLLIIKKFLNHNHLQYLFLHF
jgi:hypothetical protein